MQVKLNRNDTLFFTFLGLHNTCISVSLSALFQNTLTKRTIVYQKRIIGVLFAFCSNYFCLGKQLYGMYD